MILKENPIIASGLFAMAIIFFLLASDYFNTNIEILTDDIQDDISTKIFINANHIIGNIAMFIGLSFLGFGIIIEILGFVKTKKLRERV